MEVFMKTPVGIVGYGNLGKAVAEKLKTSHDFQLVAIFSKRKLPNCVDYKDILNYKDKISILFLCGGSQNELEDQAFSLIKHFNIIECYDNHQRLKSYITKLNKLAKQHKKIALCSFGWDPGLFSMMRGLFSAMGEKAYTFWGKGLSQGHTQAIKNVKNVIDAIQFTVPNEELIKKIKQGTSLDCSEAFHKRMCFVTAEKEHYPQIEEHITHMKDYFDTSSTVVSFVSQKELDTLKSFAHKGEVLTKNNKMNFSLNLPSNPDFTASVLTTFAKNIENLQKEKQFGAHTIFDIPMKNIVDDKFKYL